MIENYQSSDTKSEIVEAIAFSDKLIAKYLNSPVKRSEKNTLNNYFKAIERASKQLNQSEVSLSHSLSLIPRNAYSPEQWSNAVAKASVNLELGRAVSAIHNRNLNLRSVFPDFFKFLLNLSESEAFAYFEDLISSDTLDPDIARDLCITLQDHSNLSQLFISKAIEWSADESLLRHWPALVYEADRLLRIHSIRRWIDQGEEFKLSKSLSHCDAKNDDQLQRWLHNAISAIGESLDYFSEQASLVQDGDEEAWRRRSLFQELNWLDKIISPMMLISDLILNSPNGAKRFALCIFGFTSNYEAIWRRKLVELSANAIRRRFILDLKACIKPGKTIHYLCFGDDSLELSINKELDLLTEDFDSLKQREVVVERLSYVYASYRENKLMNQDISRRYRRMMRALHEDHLGQLLTEDELDQIKQLKDCLKDLSTIAAASRKYLQIRRSLDKETEEILIADIEFALSIRKLRQSYLHRLLLQEHN